MKISYILRFISVRAKGRERDDKKAERPNHERGVEKNMRSVTATAGATPGHDSGDVMKTDNGARIASVVKANCGRAVVNLSGTPEVLDQIATSLRYWADFDVDFKGLTGIGTGTSCQLGDQELRDGEVRRAFMVMPDVIAHKEADPAVSGDVGLIEFMAKNGVSSVVAPLTYDGSPVLMAAIIGRTMVFLTNWGISVIPNTGTLMSVFTVGGKIKKDSMDASHQSVDKFVDMRPMSSDQGSAIVKFVFESSRCVGDAYAITVSNVGHGTVRTHSNYELKSEVRAERERDRVTSGSFRPVVARRLVASDIPGAMVVGSRPHVHNG